MKKNIVIFLCDQLRRHALSVYDNPDCQTPHLDALAENGTRFSRAYSTYPICVPFRHTLMTGVSGYQADVPAFDYSIPEQRRTLADEFNEAGYETALFGKWHLCAHAERGIPQSRQGRWQTFVYSDGFPKYDGIIHLTDPRNGETSTGFDTDLFTDLAIEWLDKERDKNKPFCLNVSLSAPHDVKRPRVELYDDDPLNAPDKFFYRAPEEYMDRWKDRPVSRHPNFMKSENPEHHAFLEDAIRGYYAMIEHLDDAFGRFMNYLKQTGLHEDTIVVFLSDHGDLLGSHCTNHKGLPYEESNGIPLIVSGPGVETDKVVDTIVHTEDFFPTLLGLCGLSSNLNLSGEDCSSLVFGTSDDLDRDGVFLEFHREDRQDFQRCHPLWRGYVNKDFKYAALKDDKGEFQPWLMFDLRNDPYEQHNLIHDEAYKAIVEKLHEYMVQQMNSCSTNREREQSES